MEIEGRTSDRLGKDLSMYVLEITDRLGKDLPMI